MTLGMILGHEKISHGAELSSPAQVSYLLEWLCILLDLEQPATTKGRDL